MSQNSSPTYKFKPSDYDSTVPKFLNAVDFNRDLRFATKIIPLRLNTTKHSVITIEINPSDNVDFGCVSFTHPNGIWLSSSTDKNGLFIPSDDKVHNLNVFKKDRVKGISKYYVIINVGHAENVDSEVSDILLINIGLGRINFDDEISSVSITYDCPVEIYSYNVGLHVYSPYDSIYNSKLRTILYSFTKISEWGFNTLVYSSPSFSNPALPYYYGYGDKVYKVGSLIDRAFGTTFKYRVVSKNIITWGGTFTSTKVTEVTDGPRSYYNSDTDTSPACVIPLISGVGKIKEIILKTTLIQPLRYRYYLGYDDNIRRDSSYSTFTAYKFNGEQHLPIVGSFHAFMKLGSGLVNGWDSNERPDWRKIVSFRGMSGISNNKDGIGIPLAAAGLDTLGLLAYGLQLPTTGSLARPLLLDFRGTCGCGGGSAAKTLAGKSKFLAKIFGKVAITPGVGMIILGAILLFIIIKVLVKFFKKHTVTLEENCKNFLHRYTPTPYIEIGNKILDREGNVSTPGLYYCDGIYYYSQTNNGTVTSKINCTDSFYDYEEDDNEPITYSIQTSTTPDNPKLVIGWEELIILPYTSGKPEPVCFGTIYYSPLMEKIVPNKSCALETPTQTTIRIPAKQEFSCISQLDANNKAARLLNDAYEYAVTLGNYSESIPDVNIGILNSIYTNSSWVEEIGEGTSILPAKSEGTTLFFDNTDSLGLTVGKNVYFDPSGCQKALKGFYTGAPTGGFDEENPSKLINQPIKTYQIESGKIKSISNQVQTKTLYPSYSSNWFLFDTNSSSLNLLSEDMDNSRVFDPLTLENNPKSYQGLVKKTSKDDYSGVEDFLIFSGGTYVQAPSGYYLPLIDWIRHSPFYYNQKIEITLNVSGSCETSTNRGFYIIGVNKITNSITPLFNAVKLEVIVKSSNGKTNTYSATTSSTLDKTLIPYGTFFTSTDVINSISISKIISQNPLNNFTYLIGGFFPCIPTPIAGSLCVGLDVIIGTQTWKQCNAGHTTYRDGTEIPHATTDADWIAKGNAGIGAWRYYNNPANGDIYGKLYNWYAVAGIYNSASLSNSLLRKQFAPTGYHVPSDAEFTQLTDYLAAQLPTGNVGGKMKSTGTIEGNDGRWFRPNTNATNSNGFKGQPGGFCYQNGTFEALSYNGLWWSSTEYNPTIAFNRSLAHSTGDASRNVNYKTFGFSVRLIKDSSPSTPTPTKTPTPTPTKPPTKYVGNMVVGARSVFYGYYSNDIGSLSPTTINIGGSNIQLHSLYYHAQTGDIVFTIKNNSDTVSPNWTTLTIGSLTYNRTPAISKGYIRVYAYWLWIITAPNPFGTTVGATRTITLI